MVKDGLSAGILTSLEMESKSDLSITASQIHWVEFTGDGKGYGGI